MQIEFTVSGLKPTPRKREKPIRETRQVAPVVEAIVLAYQIEQAIKEDRARDGAEVARQLGLTRARVSQIMRLLSLPASMLERLVLAEPAQNAGLTERQLRPVMAARDPDIQLELFDGLFSQIQSPQRSQI